MSERISLHAEPRFALGLASKAVVRGAMLVIHFEEGCQVWFKARCVLSTCVILIVAAIPVIAADDTTDGQTRQVVDNFLKAVKAKDIDGMMKIVDVPFGSGDRIIKDEKELKQLWQAFLKGPQPGRWEVKKIVSNAQFRETFKGEKNLLNLLDQLKLTANDRVIVESSGVIIIRTRDGEAKIAAIIDSDNLTPGKGSVFGQVMFDTGIPLFKGKVFLQPAQGARFESDILADGTFQFKDVATGGYSLAVGSMGVAKKYSDPKTSGLRLVVKKGSNYTKLKVEKE